MALKWKKEEILYGDKEWKDDEIRAFESAILDFGPELRSVRDQIITRTLPEVVRFFTLWKTYVFCYSTCISLMFYI